MHGPTSVQQPLFGQVVARHLRGAAPKQAQHDGVHTLVQAPHPALPVDGSQAAHHAVICVPLHGLKHGGLALEPALDLTNTPCGANEIWGTWACGWGWEGLSARYANVM
jgi:hypothetical protein